MQKPIEIMDISFCNLEASEVVAEIKTHINDNRKKFIVTANPEIVMYAKENPSYKKIIAEADYVLADGIGVVIASKILGTPIKERVAGFDLMGELLAHANEKQLKVYFLGAKPEVIAKTVENIQTTYPQINVVGYHHGFFDHGDPAVVDEIAKHAPDLIFVALGYPAQEKWIKNNLSKFSKGVFMGVGGSFDVWAGVAKRAPLVWQKLNVEWLYRLLKQPSRWRRMLVLPHFLLEIYTIKIKRRK